MSKGRVETWPWSKKDAGGLDTMVSEIGPERTLAVLVLRQAVQDWARAQSAERGRGEGLRRDLHDFLGGEWFALLANELHLEASQIVNRLERSNG